MLTRLRLSDFGQALATREKAREVDRYLVNLGSKGDCQLVLDFTGVSALSPSFADELLSVLAKHSCDLWVIGLADEIYQLLNSIAVRRSARLERTDEASIESLARRTG